MPDTDQDVSKRLEGLLRALDKAGEHAPDLPMSFGFAAEFPRVERVARKGFSRTEQLAIFQRDSFIDRYTGERLFFPGVLLLLGRLFPKAFPRPASNEGWRVGKCHWIYWRLWPTVDHVVPVARAPAGFDVHGDDNLVTTSQMINTAKSVWAAEEAPPAIRFTPSDVATVKTNLWDGMLGWYVGYYKQNKTIIQDDPDIAGWHKAAENRLRGLITRDSPPDTIQWNDDDFNLDSHGVEAPEREVFEMFAEIGTPPDEVNEAVRERYRKYLERIRKKAEHKVE